MKPGLVFVLLLILVVLLALVLVTRGRACAAAAVVGGAWARRGRRVDAATGGSRDPRAAPAPPPLHTPHHLHPVGLALHDYARTLGPGHVVGTHPLDRGRYEPLARASQSHGGAAKKAAKSNKPWDEYDTWEALQKDEGALAAYIEQRAAVLNNPDLDWGPVLADMGPKLKENREHIGIASLAADGRTLRLVASEASPLEAGEMESETAFAGVPGELVAKYASRPGLFLFHTHPADPRGSPLPSSHDLSTAIYFGATSRFAACAVISRYGVLVHGLDWSAYKAVNEAKDWKLAVLSLSHDVVAAHEAVRSWSAYTIADYLGFYPRHRLLMFVYPSPEMVGDSRRYSYLWNLESPIDHDLIAEHSKDIAEHRSKVKKSSRARKAAAFSTEPAEIPLGFD
jgi:hypothetical protein